jgi:cytidine deaminase
MGGERLPNSIRNFETPGYWQLFEASELPEEERAAVESAIAAYHRSTNQEFRAGACAVAEDGTSVARHNEYRGENKGQEGHAEMLALASLYRAVKPTEKKLKIMAFAGSAAGEELVTRTDKYGKNVRFNDIGGESICGRCRKFISDFTGNFLSPETGKDDPKDRGPIVLMVADSGQILRTDLRTLYPKPHYPRIMYPESLAQNMVGPPDRLGSDGN